MAAKSWPRLSAPEGEEEDLRGIGRQGDRNDPPRGEADSRSPTVANRSIAIPGTPSLELHGERGLDGEWFAATDLGSLPDPLRPRPLRQAREGTIRLGRDHVPTTAGSAGGSQAPVSHTSGSSHASATPTTAAPTSTTPTSAAPPRHRSPRRSPAGSSADHDDGPANDYDQAPDHDHEASNHDDLAPRRWRRVLMQRSTISRVGARRGSEY